MRRAGRGVTAKPMLIAVVCIIIASVLLIAALFEPKREAAGEWVPMNEAVEEALGGKEKETAEANNVSADEKASAGDKAIATSEESKQTEMEADSLPEIKPETNTDALAEAHSSKAESSLTGAGKLNINLATAAELDSLKGIGPSKAQAIIEDRDRNGLFASVDDLLRVKGIGEKLLDGIKDSVVVKP